MRDSIERFLVQKSFKPLTKRTRVLVEYVYLVLTRDEQQDINTSPVKEVSKRFGLTENNVIQLLYQSKKHFGTDTTPKELAYRLAQDYKEWKKQND
jgi:hypothetical protein